MTALFVGNVSTTTQVAGIHFKQPLSAAVPFDVRTQLLETSQDVPTNEGLVVHVDGAQMPIDATRGEPLCRIQA